MSVSDVINNGLKLKWFFKNRIFSLLVQANELEIAMTRIVTSV